jgi:hypothetical protein
MQLVSRIVFVIGVCAAVTVLGVLAQNIPGVALSIGVLLVLLGIDWRCAALEKRIKQLEEEVACQRAHGSATDPVASLGDLKNPSPDQLAKVLGSPKL